eukprot:s1857_g10.t1
MQQLRWPTSLGAADSYDVICWNVASSMQRSQEHAGRVKMPICESSNHRQVRDIFLLAGQHGMFYVLASKFTNLVGIFLYGTWDHAVCENEAA